MANIKNLQMWNDICKDSRVSISKSFLGLRTTATYVPTQSVIDAHIFQYSPEEGRRLKDILETPMGKLEKAIGDFRPKDISNGNYLLEVCLSHDGQFAALLLKQFSQMNYEPVTNTLFFEGDGAKAISKLF